MGRAKISLSLSAHSAAVMIKSNGVSSGHVATWINVLDVVRDGEPCLFLLPDGNVVTGPEWCEHVGLPEQQQQQWQQCITVTESNGGIAKGQAISEVLSQFCVDSTACQAMPATEAGTNMQCTLSAATQQQAAGDDAQLQVPLSPVSGKQHGGNHQMEVNIVIQKPSTTESAEQTISDQHLHLSMHDNARPGMLDAQMVIQQGDRQLQEEHAEIKSILPADSKQPLMALPGPSQLTTETDDTGWRQHAITQAVRVTLTNYDTHQTVYALWTNTDDVLQPNQACSPTEAMFLPCKDENYQPAMDAMLVNATGLARMALISHRSHSRDQVRLNQRFRAATGHCFYPGMSLKQVMLVVSSGHNASQLCFGQDWDETATDPVATYDTTGQVYVRVMALHTGTMLAVCGEARCTVQPHHSDRVMFVKCDTHYNVQQPHQLVPGYEFVKQAGFSCRARRDHYNILFLTQALQLPSGCILQPGTYLHQVIKAAHEQLPAVSIKDMIAGIKSSQDDIDAIKQEAITPPAVAGPALTYIKKRPYSIQAQTDRKRAIGNTLKQPKLEPALQPNIKPLYLCQSDAVPPPVTCTTMTAAHTEYAPLTAPTSPPPLLPDLHFGAAGRLTSQSELQALSAMGKLLRWLGCKPSVNKQLFDAHKKTYNTRGADASRDFGVQYVQLKDAVDSGDQDYIRDVLKDGFQLDI